MASAYKCSDCETEMQQIKLVDKSHHARHDDMEYAATDTERSFWTGRFPIEGQVLAFMCPECGRIALYGAEYALKGAKQS